MTRFVVVLGTGRCGSSAVAGMLDRLGVHMGRPFAKREKTNPRGNFEDVGFNTLCRMAQAGMLSPEKLPEAFRVWFAKRVTAAEWRAKKNCELAIFGVKSPRLCEYWEFLEPQIGIDTRLIAVDRPTGEVVASFHNAYGIAAHDALAKIQRRRQVIDRVVDGWPENRPGPLRIGYDLVVNRPLTAAAMLAAHVFATPIETQRHAADLVDRSLRNFGRVD